MSATDQACEEGRKKKMEKNGMAKKKMIMVKKKIDLFFCFI